MPPDLKIPNNSEIDKALKEFELQKSGEVPTKPQAIASQTSELPGMVRLVMKLSGGAIKEQRQAEYVLLGVVVGMIALSLYLLFAPGSKTPAPSAEDLYFTPPSNIPLQS